MGQADLVLSDMAAATTGHRATDHLRTMGLLEVALDFAIEVLNPGGVFLAKAFRGGTDKALLDALNQHFEKVRHVKPDASRAESVETYLLATGFKGEGADHRVIPVAIGIANVLMAWPFLQTRLQPLGFHLRQDGVVEFDKPAKFLVFIVEDKIDQRLMGPPDGRLIGSQLDPVFDPTAGQAIAGIFLIDLILMTATFRFVTWLAILLPECRFNSDFITAHFLTPSYRPSRSPDSYQPIVSIFCHLSLLLF